MVMVQTVNYTLAVFWQVLVQLVLQSAAVVTNAIVVPVTVAVAALFDDYVRTYLVARLTLVFPHLPIQESRHLPCYPENLVGWE